MIVARLIGLGIFVALALIVMKLTKKALQNSDLTGKLEEQDNLRYRLALARKLSPKEIKQAQAEIKKQTGEI